MASAGDGGGGELRRGRRRRENLRPAGGDPPSDDAAVEGEVRDGRQEDVALRADVEIESLPQVIAPRAEDPTLLLRGDYIVLQIRKPEIRQNTEAGICISSVGFLK